MYGAEHPLQLFSGKKRYILLRNLLEKPSKYLKTFHLIFHPTPFLRNPKSATQTLKPTKVNQLAI
jgi:hypothetical protein